MSIEVSVASSLSPEQVTAVTGVCERATAADGVQPLSEHVRLHLRHGGEGPDRHLLVVRPGGRDGGSASSDGGAIIAYAHLDPTDLVAGPVAELAVDPEERGHGVGSALVAATIDAARRESGSRRLRLWAHGVHPAARPLALKYGFSEGRRLEQWGRVLDDTLPPAALPDGVRLRSFRVGVDDDAWLELNARAFAGHPEQGSWTEADLSARLAEDWFDPNGFLLAEMDGELVGFHWTKVHGARSAPPGGAAGSPRHASGEPGADLDHGHEPIGEVYVVGVDPSHQGLGLGRALTLAGLHWLVGQGLTQAMLYVEADNAAAQATYRGLGFRHWDTDVMFYRPGD